MYSQLIYLLVVLVLFTLQQPGAQPLLSPLETLLLALLLLFVFGLACHLSLRRLNRATWYVPQSVLTRLYHRIENRLTILAVGFVAVDIYILNIKFYLQIIPGFDQSLTLSGITGIGLFLLHVFMIWLWSHPVYRNIYHSDITLPAFLKSQLAFISAILIPWFLISLASDLLQLIELPSLLGSELGQFLLLAILLLIFVLFAPWLVVRLWGCKPLPAGNIQRELERFCNKNNFGLGGFMLWPLFGSEMLTAGIIGILPKWRYILITKGLLSVLDIDELRAVVAHEMGHVRRFHMVIYLIFFVGYSILAYSFHDVIFLFLLKNDVFLNWAMAHDSLSLTLFSIAYAIPILLLLVLYFRYIFGFFMRNSERQADLYALRLIGNPHALISSLQKIAFHSGRIEDLPSWHHFSIRQRIDFLVDSYRNPALIRKHDRKLYGSIVIFLALLIGLSLSGNQLQETKAIQRWRTQVQAQVIEKQIQGKAADPELLAAYGGLMLDLGRYQTALSFLKRALALAPHNPTILNNLAWLYATSPQPYFHPDEALKLALQAAANHSEPYILDTLAEAYYANGLYRKALETIKQALAENPENRGYYLEQMEKFEKAANSSKEKAEGVKSRP